MGQVFLGSSPGGQLVAVKVIRPELARDPGFRIRFAREVAAARNVSGLFTALVVNADVEGPMPWLATAYVAGPSLAAAVDEQGPLPIASVLKLAAGLAEGLAAIHEAGLVHRDLKPSNVLLAHDGPRVIDFGISRAAEATVLTKSGEVMGSPGFMSPEQAEGGTIGPASDVFSLGAVLAFAATGEGPFGTGPTPALMYRVVHVQPDITRLPGQIRPLVGRCLAKDPGERPTTGDLLAELGGGHLAADWLPTSLTRTLGRYDPQGPMLAAGPIVTGPDDRVRPAADTSSGPGSTPGHPPARNRRLLAAVVAAAVLIVAASTAAAITLSSGNGSHRSPTASSSSARPSVHPASSARSSGATTSTVPAVVGYTRSAAIAALEGKGFYNIPWLYDCYGSGNYLDVVRQDPNAGAVTALTAPVHLYLQANNCHRVPDVGGLNLSSAEYQLKQAGFTNIQYMYRCYNSPNIGEVVHQSPAEGSSYGATEPVTINLQASNC